MRLTFILLSLVVLASCSRKSAQELLHEGNQAYDDKLFDKALDLYQQAVDRQPESAFAETAQYRVASIYSNDRRDSVKALEAYQKFYRRYPSSTEAPTALFLAGFIYNNELHNIDSARVTYEEFLNKYPSHSLAQSARFELQTLGKDPAHFFPSTTTSGSPDAGSKTTSK